MIEHQCPACDHTLRIDEKYAGLKGRCKYCKEIFRVPSVVTPYVPLVDPGADKASKHRYAKGGSNFLVLVVISCVVVVSAFAMAFQWIQSGEIQSTVIDPELVDKMKTYSTVNIAGITVAVFGEATFVENNSSIPSSGPLNMLTKNQLQSYRATVDNKYSDAVSDYQLALTDLGWDFVIVHSASGDWTELFGTVDGHEACLRINHSEIDQSTEILLTAKKQ
jgi:hypothetical protein